MNDTLLFLLMICITGMLGLVLGSLATTLLRK